MKAVSAKCFSVLALSLGLIACGGSASETPWPVEPDNIDLGPSGETRRDDALIKKPDNQKDAPADSTVAPSGRPKKVDPTAP